MKYQFLVQFGSKAIVREITTQYEDEILARILLVEELENEGLAGCYSLITLVEKTKIDIIGG